jgi:histidine triad (HIT) family protein
MADEQPDMAEQQKKCIFCQIISGKVKSRKVYEDEEFLAILDINPAVIGHILLLPKRHVVILPQLSDPEISHLSVVAKNLSRTLLKAYQAKGTNIFVANGAVAGQRAPHFMLHIIPRQEGDGLSLAPPKNNISESDLTEVRKRLLPQVREMFRLSDQQMALLEMSAHPVEEVPEITPSTHASSVPASKIHSKVDFDAIEDFFKKDGMQNLRPHKEHKK